MTSLKGDDWFDILDPKSKAHIYINSITGDCQLEQPNNFHKLKEVQWWEFYDFTRHHFYYYNVKKRICTWEKPDTVKMVSFVKYQVNKERSKKTFADQITQTSLDDNVAYNLNHEILNNRKHSMPSALNASNNIYPSFGIVPTTDTIADRSVSFTVNRKPITKSKPKYAGQSKNLQMSKHVELSEYDFIADEPGSFTNRPKYISSISVEDKITSEYDSLPNTSPTNHLDNSTFLRTSVKNAIELNIPKSTETWSNKLFTKSGSDLAGVMSWTLKPISDCLLSSTPRASKKKACEIFRYIQMYMGDRERNSEPELLILTICKCGISKYSLSDEIFMQLCKQVSHNPSSERTFYGWDLICVCLMFFHPVSVEMNRCFKSFLEQHACFSGEIYSSVMDGDDFDAKSMFCARMALKLLEMLNKANEITVEDVNEAKKSYAAATIFYSSLNEVMEAQRHLYPARKLPWIQVALTREILRCNGRRTSGILRIPSEMSKIESITFAIEKSFKRDSEINVNDLPISNECDPLLNKILEDLGFEHDPLLLSSVLKYWLRHFLVPLVSFDKNGDGEDSLSSIANDNDRILQKLGTLPEINNLVFKYFIYFLQELAKPENVSDTNMSVESIVTVMTPTLFKLEFNELQPAMHLLHNLINNLDTSDVVNLI